MRAQISKPNVKQAILFVLILLSETGFAQPAINQGLKTFHASDPDQMISLIVRGNKTSIEKIINGSEGRIKFSYDSLFAIMIPAGQLAVLLSEKNIHSIEAFNGKCALLDDMTDSNTHMNLVREGVAPLDSVYTGKNVVIGIIDDGIDFHHKDFQNADGSTRIKFLWDQNADSGGSIPQPFGYGQEWTAAEIDSGKCTSVEPANEFGHGSNVSGIAAGNGLALNNYFGIATEADMIVVAANLDDNSQVSIADAAQYIFTKADSLHEPCVINVSLGNYAGSHDGQDLVSQMIGKMLEEHAGRSFVCAAGNAGNIPFHLGYETQPDSAFTWFAYNLSTLNTSFECWLNKTDAKNFSFAIGADKINPYQYLGRTLFFNPNNDFDTTQAVFTIHDSLFTGDRYTEIFLTETSYDSSISLDIDIQSQDPDLLWRFITNGSGRFDCWSNSTLTSSSNIIAANLPDSNSFHDIVRYKLPDTKQTLCSSFQCSDHVITVGNFINRNSYIDVDSVEVNFPQDTVGHLALNSSRGPTRTEKIKPDVCAPGNRTLASGNLQTLLQLIIHQPEKVALGGLHNSNGGTSMAAPVVAGIAALYLQKNPTADWKRVRDAISYSAYTDAITGNNLPDDNWGHGKADAFQTMISKFGCTDPHAINYDPSATIDNDSCIYELNVASVHDESGFLIFPNPAHSEIEIQFKLQNQSTDFFIMNEEGEQCYRRKLADRDHEIIKLHLEPGMYFCGLKNEKRLFVGQKLVIE